MTYNHYKFLLDNYRKRSEGMIGADAGIVAVRKALHQSYQHDASRARERYRQDMASQKRQQMDNERLINLKIRELKKKEREISKRYEHIKARVTYEDTRTGGRSADNLPKISYARSGGPKKGISLPNRKQRFVESRYEYETFPRTGKGKEHFLLLPSIDVSESSASDNGGTLIKLDRQSQFPTLPQQKFAKTSSSSQAAAANMDRAAVRELPNSLQAEFQSSVMQNTPRRRDETVSNRVGYTHNLPALVNHADPIASPLETDFTRELVQYYKSRIEGFRLNPDVEDLSSSLQKPDKYEMLLLDSLDPRPEQIRVYQVDPRDPRDPRSTFDILSIEEDEGASDSQEE